MPADMHPPSGSRGPERSPGERALGVETEVVRHDGQWAVEIVVLFADGVVRHRVATFRSERLARIGARSIKRGAEREA